MQFGPITIVLIVAFVAIAAAVVVPIFFSSKTDADTTEDLDYAALVAENERAIAAKMAKMQASRPRVRAVPVMHRLDGDGLDWLESETAKLTPAVARAADDGDDFNPTAAVDKAALDFDLAFTGATYDPAGVRIIFRE